MPAFNVRSEETINVSMDKVHDALSDFHTWPTWSPWLIMEKECTLEYQGTPGAKGHGYTWSGQKVGAGEMTLVSVGDRQNPKHRQMDCKLVFLKPFKSKADVDFKLDAISDASTRVSWGMSSSLPFFMFFMVKKMVAMITSDYDRGLGLLKEYLETGSVHIKIEVDGVVDTPNVNYHGVAATTSKAGMHDSMQSSYSTLMSGVRDSDLEITGYPFAIYPHVDMVHDKWSYVAAVPTSGDVVLNGINAGSRPAAKAMKVTHNGSYRHLGNAWSCAMSEMQHHKLKPSKTNHPFEVYVTDPERTPENDLVTEIYVPIR